MKLRTKALAAGLAAGAAPLLLGVGTAAADSSASDSVDHTFTTTAGATVTCTVHGDSTLFGEGTDPRRRAQATTSAFGPSAACAPGYANVIVTYKNTSGTTASGSAGAYADGVTWSGDDVDGDDHGFSARHLYRFADCSADCTVDFTTAPK
jgi:hypothetical protein